MPNSDDLDDPQWSKLYAAIGRVAAEWAAFEVHIDGACISLGQLDIYNASCLTAQIAGSARKLDAYIAIAKFRGVGEDYLKILNKFADETRKLAEKRNRIVHDPWVIQHTPSRYEVTARKNLRMGFVPNSIKDFADISHAITKHLDRLNELHEQICKELAVTSN